jgi:hypothetical protein
MSTYSSEHRGAGHFHRRVNGLRQEPIPVRLFRDATGLERFKATMQADLWSPAATIVSFLVVPGAQSDVVRFGFDICGALIAEIGG